MIIVNIVFYVLVILILIGIGYILYTKLRAPEMIVPNIDVTLKDVNYFIRREVLFNFISWFNSKILVKNMSNPDQTSSLVSELKSPDVIQQKMNNITLYILSTMSPALKANFFSVYSKSAYDDPNDMLSVYISRQVMFFIRKVNVDITALFTNNPEEPTDKLLKAYIVSLENEIHEDNNIEIIKNVGMLETTTDQK